MACSSFTFDHWGSVLVATALVILIISLFRILQYMASILLKQERMKTMAVLGLRDALSTILLVGVAAVLPSLLLSIASSVGVDANTYGDLLQPPSIVEELTSYTTSQGGEGLKAYAYLSYINSFSLSTDINVGRWARFNAALQAQSPSLYLPYVSQVLSYLYLFTAGLRVVGGILCYLAFISLYYLLPLGFVARATGIFSRVGSTLIAVGLTVAFFLPIFAHLLSQLLLAFYQEPAPIFTNVMDIYNMAKAIYAFFVSFATAVIPLSLITSLPDFIYDLMLIGFIYDLALMVKTFFSLAVMAVIGVFKALAQVTTFSVLTENLLSRALESLAYLFIVVSIYLFAVAFFAVGLIRALSTHLGGEYFLYRVANYVG